MFRITAVVLSLLLVSLTGNVSFAQETPLAQFTEDVDIIVRLREPDQTFEKLVKVVNKIQPGIGDAVQAQKAAVLGQLISNPTLTGVDETRDWYVGVYTNEEAPPTIVFAIPATSTGDFVAALGDGFKTQIHKTWVIYTDAEEIPSVEDSEPATELLSDAAQSRLKNGDLTVFVNAGHLSEVYSDQIELAQENILEALNNLRHVMPPQGDLDGEAVAQMYTQFAEVFFQMVSDADAVSLSLSVSETEIALDKFVEFDSESDTAEFLASSKPSRFEKLAQLPANWPMYSGASGNMQQFMEWNLLASTSLLKLEGEKKELADKMKEELQDFEFGATVMAYDIADTTSAAMRGVGLFEVTPTHEFQKLTRQGLEAFGTISTGSLDQTITLQIDAESYGSHKADIVIMKQTHKDDPTGVAQKMVDILLGEEGMECRYSVVDDLYLSTVGPGRKLMEDLIKSIETKKSNRIEKARGSLMPEANFLMLLDLPGIAARGVKVASKVEDVPLMIDSSAIDNLGLKTSYIGIAVGSEENTLKSQLRIPLDQITDMTKLGVLIGASLKPGL
ncbi:MAG TPA: hypothetical protein VNQ76_08180 [Planctomicrobium sp.]|nr:hypothetical protein [Planctomicrobium sp.]